MIVTLQSWKKLFLFCFGIAAGTAFCMKWMENDFRVQGQLFTILGLELFYPREKLAGILSGLDGHVKTILRYHLVFDFVFIAGVYPGIASLCILAKEKVKSLSLKKLLYILAVCQLVAWVADGIENYYLLQWIEAPQIGENEFGWYHFIVALKWIIIIISLLLAIPLSLKKNKKTVSV